MKFNWLTKGTVNFFNKITQPKYLSMIGRNKLATVGVTAALSASYGVGIQIWRGMSFNRQSPMKPTMSYGPGYVSWGKCLAESTYLFCKINNVYTFSVLKDLKRLVNSEIYIPGIDENYNIIWTKIVKFYNTEKKDGIQIICDDGSNIISTLDHRHLCLVGDKILNKETNNIEIGDVICSVSNIEIEKRNFPDIFDLEWAWFIGIFIAEGNKTKDGFTLSLCNDEVWIAERVLSLFKKRFGISGSYKVENKEEGNGLLVVVYGSKFVHSMLDEFVNGTIAINKFLTTKCFNFGKEWLEKLIDGFLVGDGYYDKVNNRYEVGITTNYILTYQFKCICKLLNWRLRHRPRIVRNKKLSKLYKAIKMEIKKDFECCIVYKEVLGNKNIRELKVIDKIPVTGMNFIDIEIESENHLFVLGNGVITHNSSGMPANHLSTNGLSLSLSKMRHTSVI